MLGFSIKNTKIREGTGRQQTMGLCRKCGFPEQVSCLSIKENSKEKLCYLFHASFAHKMRKKIYKKTKPRIQNSEPKEYSNPLGVNIFKVQLTGLKTQYALNNLHRKFHSGLVSCCFVSGVSTMVSGNIKFLAGHERAMLVIVM